MPGPLPGKPDGSPTRRRNPATIPTTNLPARGRKGAAPKPPVGYAFGERASAWWKWAWKQPQAAGWSTGDLYVVARRAQLEDDLAALEYLGFEPAPVEDLEHLELLAWLDNVKQLLRLLRSMAGGKLAVLKEIRELDDRLGLTPKGLAALRWKIVDDDQQGAGHVRQLRAVPAPSAAAEEDPRRLLGG